MTDLRGTEEKRGPSFTGPLYYAVGVLPTVS